jgi:hypothetical protein
VLIRQFYVCACVNPHACGILITAVGR